MLADSFWFPPSSTHRLTSTGCSSLPLNCTVLWREFWLLWPRIISSVWITRFVLFFLFNDDNAPTLSLLLSVWADFKCKFYGVWGSVCKAKASKAMYLQTDPKHLIWLERKCFYLGFKVLSFVVWQLPLSFIFFNVGKFQNNDSSTQKIRKLCLRNARLKWCDVYFQPKLFTNSQNVWSFPVSLFWHFPPYSLGSSLSSEGGQEDIKEHPHPAMNPCSAAVCQQAQHHWHCRSQLGWGISTAFLLLES